MLPHPPTATTSITSPVVTSIDAGVSIVISFLVKISPAEGLTSTKSNKLAMAVFPPFSILQRTASTTDKVGGVLTTTSRLQDVGSHAPTLSISTDTFPEPVHFTVIELVP